MKVLLVLMLIGEMAYAGSQFLSVETFAYPPLVDEKAGFINDIVEEVSRTEKLNLRVDIFPYPRFVSRMKNDKGFCQNRIAL